MTMPAGSRIVHYLWMAGENATNNCDEGLGGLESFWSVLLGARVIERS